jgi:cyclopropane-fatty-acyl-phospholipid synthase
MGSKIIQQLFAQAGIAINGSNPWDIQVHNERLYDRIVREKNLGLGEAYMDGWWDCERLDEFFCRLLKSNIEEKIKGNLRYLLRFLPAIVFNPQSRSRARIVADRHYDIDNELFLSFLDSYNQYSCGYFEGTDDLEQAQRKKLDLICRKLDITGRDHVLDIGCGWGGLSRYIAKHYGAQVTAVNVSREQLSFARNTCKDLSVRFLDCDYRAIRGTFDKIVSVGMFEHVGRKNYRTFMEIVKRCLNGTGIFLLHTIGNNRSQANCDPWINRYIFPNGMLPSITQIARAVDGLFIIEDWQNIGPHYDKTLMAWHENFKRAWSRLQEKYDTRFKRMWDYYLLSCAGAFRARDMQVWQIVMTQAGSGPPQPVCLRN